jgi:hypothetical protein
VEVVESSALVTIQWIKLILESTGALLVGFGAVIAPKKRKRSPRKRRSRAE